MDSNAMTVAKSNNGDASKEWVDRYLTVLGVEWSEPSLDALTAITRAHLREIHFENITSLLRRAAHPEGPVPPLDPEALLANWEHRRGGGVCYEIASMVERLLRGLGYRAFIAPGQIVSPAGHLAVVVEVDGGRYLVDLGNGAPLHEPIPLDREVEVHRAGLGFRFRLAETEGVWLQERLIHGEWQSFCRYTLAPVSSEDREDAYQGHHRPGHSWVTGEPRTVRCRENAVSRLTLREFEVHTADGKRTEPVDGPEDFARWAADDFDLPGLPVSEAIAAWEWANGVAANDRTGA
jgi:arylamine N-acetyltransferase